MTEKSFTCRGCGCQFTGRKRIYCTKQCQSKTYSYNRCRSQGRKPREEISANAACNQMHDCLACGKMFKPKRAGRVMACSRECGFKVNGAIQKLKRTGGRVWVRTKRNVLVPHNQHDVKNCLQCNEVLISTRPNIKARSFCDYKCRDAFKGRREAFDCAECEKHVIPDYGNKMRVFCSKNCSRKHSRRTEKTKRKAMIKGAQKSEHVHPFKVFDRDGWRCQICMKKTLRSKRGTTHNMAPELDHILPLSKGGDHTYANTQCTCRRCNGLKGDNVYGQIPMFAT